MYVVEAEKFGKDKNVAYYPKDFTSATQADATINYDLPLAERPDRPRELYLRNKPDF